MYQSRRSKAAPFVTSKLPLQLADSRLHEACSLAWLTDCWRCIKLASRTSLIAAALFDLLSISAIRLSMLSICCWSASLDFVTRARRANCMAMGKQFVGLRRADDLHLTC